MVIVMKKIIPSAATHQTLVDRLIAIFMKLNQGESLEPKALAEEFGVNLRTIQRDLNERLAQLPFQKAHGRYTLEPSYLGKLTFQEMEKFASLSGVGGLFPELGKAFLEKLFSSLNKENNLSAWMVMGHDYEDLRPHRGIFSILEKAIIDKKWVQFRYTKGNGETKIRDKVEPYKLVNKKGIWYLAAWHDGRFKAFSISRIEAPMVNEEKFTPREGIEEELKNSDGIWLGVKRQRVVIKVNKEAARFFRRRKLLPNQQIEKEFTDGAIWVSTTIAHPDEVMPIFRYWIPHVQILEPLAMQQALEDGLRAYLQQKTT